jgi:DNA (cytosine-5)-methyltransferase 1
MRYLSICSGIEAATEAWHPLKWKPVAFAENEKFASAVLEYHYPKVPNLGDVTRYTEWKPYEKIDLLVGGTPCQSFSIAGFRKGLEDPRGNLMLTYIKIAQSYRPRWIVWENVPGVLSSKSGRDFGTFLGALGDLGYGFAFRVLDARWFGVPQRRKRVFVVGCLGDAGRAAKVLFESESLRRNFKTSEEKKQGIATTFENGSGRSGGKNQIKAFRMLAFGEYTDDETASAMKARDYKDATDLVAVTTVTPHIKHSGILKAIRRLTPIECERLQGFRDNYTQIPWNKKPANQCPDRFRYKVLGNSMAVPVMRWIGERIQKFK